MNTLTLGLLNAVSIPNGEGLSGLLIGFLVMVIILAIAGGLIYCIEQWIVKGPLPTPVRLVIGLILVVLVIIWAIRTIGGG